MILLIANYRPDGQQSMLRAADLLERELLSSGIEVVVCRPQRFFGRLAGSGSRLTKWLAYLDKYLLFPFCLIWQARRFALVHIVDHSNAVYLFWLPFKKSVVVCHDLLAVRSALGEMPEHQTAFTGRCLQKWILAGMRRASHIACVSGATKLDVLRLTGKSEKEVSTIYLGLEPIFEAELERKSTALGAEDLRSRQGGNGNAPPGEFPDRSLPYILHVGGDTWYKNGPGVLQIYLEVRRRVENLGSVAPNLIMVGSPFKAANQGVHFLREVTDAVLMDLYRHAALLLFPSFYEGFGRPVVEAHACGCPTVITGTAPLTEAAGNAAVWIDDPRDIPHAAERVMELLQENDAERRQRRNAGYNNARRFSRHQMAAQYRELYASILSE